MRRVREYVDVHLGETIDLLMLAGVAGLSVHHFARQFKQSIGVTTHHYLTQKRVERAQEMLAQTDLSLSEIAYTTGFADQSHLTRHFAARFGLGPAVAEAILLRLTASEKLIEGEFRPGGTEREWVDPDVLRSLRRREHEAAVLDGARAHQHMPMRFAGRHRKGGRHRQIIGSLLGEVAIEQRKAYIIADGKTDLAKRELHDRGFCAACKGIRFADALTGWQIDVEQMDFVITRRNYPLRVQQDRAIENAAIGSPDSN
jgi:AraC-like DNA-binding protein